jgi:uncharacterized membrane protein YbhN (UPF0104 family)
MKARFAGGLERLRLWSEQNVRLLLLLALAFVTVLVLLSMRAVEWSTVARMWGQVAPGWLLLSIAANVGVVALSTVEWRLLLPRGVHVGWKRMWRVNALTALAVSSTPFLAGHGAGVVILAREPGVGFRAAGSVLALDQLAEGLAKLVLIGLAILVAPKASWIREGGGMLAVAVALLMLALFLVGRRLLPMGKAVVGGSFPLALCAVLGMKGAEALGVLAAQQSLGIELPLATLAIVLSATALGTMLPLTPGQVGTYEASAFLAYRWLGVAPEAAMALAVVQHVSYLAGTAGAGYLMLLWTATRARKHANAPATSLSAEAKRADQPSGIA